MAEMYNVVAFHKAYAGTMVFQFNDPAKADSARLAIINAIESSDTVTVEDDYGVKALLCGGDFSAVTMTHLTRHLDGQRAGALLQEVAKAKLQQDLAADPVLKFHSQGPGFRGNPQMG